MGLESLKMIVGFSVFIEEAVHSETVHSLWSFYWWFFYWKDVNISDFNGKFTHLQFDLLNWAIYV
jgi:hypothetical protein